MDANSVGPDQTAGSSLIRPCTVYLYFIKTSHDRTKTCSDWKMEECTAETDDWQNTFGKYDKRAVHINHKNE